MRDIISAQNAVNLHELTQVKHGWITQIAWSIDGATLAIAGADHVSLFVGTFGGRPTYTLTGHEGHVKGVAFSPDNTTVATICSATTIKLWDVSDLERGVEEILTLQGHSDSVDAVAFHPAGHTLATASADGTIYLWDVASQQPRAALKGHEREVASIAFALSGNVLVSGSWDTTLRMWDSSAETQGTIIGHHEDWVREVAVNPTGTMIASAGKDGAVRLWDAHSGEIYAVVQAHPQGADCVAFSPDGTLMATGGRDNLLRIWNVHDLLRDGEGSPDMALNVLEGHHKPVMSLAFHPAGTMLASSSGDNTVRLWSIRAEAAEKDPSAAV